MKRAAIVWLVLGGLALFYEAYAVFNGIPNDTLSEAVWKYGQHPMIAFAAGVLAGHFWWQRRVAELEAKLAETRERHGLEIASLRAALAGNQERAEFFADKLDRLAAFSFEIASRKSG